MIRYQDALHRLVKMPLLLVAGLFALNSAQASDDFQVETIRDGLNHPWALAWLPSDQNRLLVTERPGALWQVALDSGEAAEIGGVPDVAATGQGGLLDVELHPEFADGERWVYLTYSAAESRNSGQYATHVGRGWLDQDLNELTDFEVLLIAEPFHNSNGHFGSRMTFHDGYLFISTGDRRQRDSAQDLQSHWGKTLRLNPDGSIPEDNPFVEDPDALDAIYTYGHRNVQGMAVEPSTGLLWQNEHGQQNGDEINIIDQPGGNYGWPIATYGVEYGSGQPIEALPEEREDTINPVYFWTGDEYDDGQQGFPPSGMAFYQGDAFPDWEGQMLMGNLAHQYLGRFELDGREVLREHRMLRGNGWRVRDVLVHPRNGEVFLIADADNAPLIRLVPAP